MYFHRLRRVSYENQDDWEFPARSCSQLQILHLESCPGIGDHALASVLDDNEALRESLKELSVVGGNNRLTAHSLFKLVKLKRLHSIGDLRDWNIPDDVRDRVTRFRGWDLTEKEPKEEMSDDGSIDYIQALLLNRQ